MVMKNKPNFNFWIPNYGIQKTINERRNPKP